MNNLKQIKELAVKAALKAGKYALSRIDNIQKISFKGSFNNLVTDVDKKCEEIVIDMVKSVFSDHSIFAEESGEIKGKDEICWIIDPLDGTTNYAHGFPVFCVSIGVLIDGEIKVGVVYDPSRDELFVAEKDQGAFLNDQRISVSKRKHLEKSLMSTGFAYNLDNKISNLENLKAMMCKVQAVRRPGSAAIDLCYVACGRFDGFWEFGLYPWDTAAGHLMISEAGGKTTLVDGKNFDIFEKSIIASNGLIHQEMIDTIIDIE